MINKNISKKQSHSSTNDLEKKIKSVIKSVKDFPVKNILFRDITPILSNPDIYCECINEIAKFAKKVKATCLAAPESRGFLFSLPVSYKLKIPFVMVRKPGKLPRQTYSVEYELEYGTNVLQIHKDSLTSKDRVLLIDDLLATGGTINAVTSLIKQAKAKIVGYAFVIELLDLNGSKTLDKKLPLMSLVKY